MNIPELHSMFAIALPAVIIASVLFVFGAGGMWINGGWLMRNRMRKLKWTSATGQITDISISGSTGSPKSYYPVMTYSHNGVQHSFQPVFGPRRPAYKIGEAIPILVNPNKPEEAVVSKFFHIYGMPGLLFVFCSVFLIAAIWGIWIESHK